LKELRIRQQSERWKLRVIVLPSLLILGLVAVSLITSTLDQLYSSEQFSIWKIALGAPLAIGAIALLIFFMIREDGLRRDWALAKLREESKGLLEKAREASDINALLEVNRALLARYHELSTGQARSSFRAAQIVMVIAAAILVLGFVIAAAAGSTATGVTVAGLSAFAAAVGGYVSTTLLRGYEISVRQAEGYFREPMVAGYLLAAERIARSLPEGSDERRENLGTVVKGFLSAAGGLAAVSSSQDKQVS
jgi:FtsH-binding integral membrane protein